MRCEASRSGVLGLLGLLGLLALLGVPGVPLGPAACRAAPAERHAAERRWETLFSRPVPGVPRGEAGRERDYLLGIKRVRRLYCNVGIGYHLQVLPGGRVSGVHSESQYSLLEISTVERGVVSLYGVRSALFVAMDSRGRLYGTAVFQEECSFRESLLPNNYNAYESAVHRGCYVALGRHGRVRRGSRASTATTATHFLPRI